MHLIFTDIHGRIVEAWREICGDIPDLTIVNDSIFSVECDALVSPANSFGFMDGGLDLRISERLGWHVQDRLQDLIRRKHHGELLVGDAEIVETGDAKLPYVIAAPTMRVPMDVVQSVNAYLATRAVLLLVKHGRFDDGAPIASRVKRIAFAGMGTGVGGMPAERCAWQMRAAIEHVLLGRSGFPETLEAAQHQHTRWYEGGL